MTRYVGTCGTDGADGYGQMDTGRWMLADGYGQRAGLPASAPNSLLRGLLARDQVKVDKIAI